VALRTADPRISRATTLAPAVPPEVVRAFNPLERAVATEQGRDELELARGTSSGLSSRAFDTMFRGEQPVRASAPRRLAPFTLDALEKPVLADHAETARESAGRLAFEKPRHSWLGRGATDPFQAAENRLRRRGVALRLGRAHDPVFLGGGVNPIDYANGLETPDRGRRWVNQRSARPGTPTPVLEAPDDVVSTGKGDSPAALGRGTVDGQDEAAAAGGASSHGLNAAFLAGAVFVAWLVLR